MHPSVNVGTKQRRLYLARHAKAVEDDAGGDHARPLSARGRSEAAALGAWLVAEAGVPELVLCSTATRTRETLAGFGLNIPTILSDGIYLASALELLAQIQGCDDAVRDVMLLGHNPGIHGLLALLVGSYREEADADRMILKFPPAACAVLSIEAAHWADMAPHAARLELLQY